MDFDLSHLNRTDQRVGFFARAKGTDSDGEVVDLVVKYDPHISGCNPYYWAACVNNRPGFEMSVCPTAHNIAKNAALSRNIASIDPSTIEIQAVMFQSQTIAINYWSE